ncbi:globin domain-containing protein [Streptomyces sp. NPDC059786]|uniref:globin domain-containing protein n=1 Tax=Streptomyces sp. NPDC059786 TaxID=3346946 RepID=UPI00364643D0
MDPEILRTSFAVVERRAEFAVKYFYAHLFRHHPDLRRLFPVDFPEETRRQRDRLFAALTHVVERLEDPTLTAYLWALGRDHRKYPVQPEHYAAVGTSLLAAFAVVLGPAWQPEVEKAWSEAYATIADAMLQGAREAAAEGEPPWWDAQVVARRGCGSDLAVLTLRPARPLIYLPGQYVSVSTPRLPGIWRPYSLGNAPRADRTVDLHVSRVERGVLSSTLVGRVREGERLRLGAPGGRFTLRTPAERPVTFIAAGSGWAPVKALLEQLVRTGDASRAESPYGHRLFVVARDLAHLYDRAAVEDLRTRLPRLAVTFITPAPGRPREQATDRLLTALGNRAHWDRHDVYLAGPPPLVEEIKAALPALGASADRIFHDLLPPAGPVRARPSDPAEWLLGRPRPTWHNPASREPYA